MINKAFVQGDIRNVVELAHKALLACQMPLQFDLIML